MNATALMHAAAPVVHPAAASGVFSVLWLIILLPALGSTVLFLGGRRTDRFGHLVGVGTVAISFVLGVICFVGLISRDAGSRQVHQHLWTWFTAGQYHVEMNLLYDQLSAVFVLLITGVGGIIHLYSVGYMAHDERRRRFFAQLNLFIAAMLTLVLAGDYILLFLGWEGVGLASYLLIGFWQARHSAARAGTKAFVVNRVGDIGLSLGVGLIFTTFGTTSFDAVSTAAPHASSGVMTGIGFLLLLAACGKSAQVPLQSWLLDAMEGPTPVSALIHAATMVTAGVYLIVRSNFIFDYTPDARTGVIVVGCVTLLWGAVIGCAKDDIKKALAGSTMSQIGYMMLGAGLGVAGYAFAIFHLLTHGFFKANMFLGAGSVMHGMNDDVNMRHYGALRKAMPVTFLTFAMGYLAIIGFPGFSGFWSKGGIIERALDDNWVAGVAAIIGAGVTGFYMTRLMLMTFFGEKRWEPEVHPHESPRVMTIPLIVLGALSAVGGLLLLADWIVNWLEPVVGPAPEHAAVLPAVVVGVIEFVVMVVGVLIAWWFVGRREVPRTAPVQVSFPVRAARADLYGEAINHELVLKPGGGLIHGLDGFDRDVIDGVVMGSASTMSGLSSWLRLTQNGYVRSYALSLLAGAGILLAAVLAVNLS